MTPGLRPLLAAALGLALGAAAPGCGGPEPFRLVVDPELKPAATADGELGGTYQGVACSVASVHVSPSANERSAVVTVEIVLRNDRAEPTRFSARDNHLKAGTYRAPSAESHTLILRPGATARATLTFRMRVPPDDLERATLLLGGLEPPAAGDGVELEVPLVATSG